MMTEHTERSAQLHGDSIVIDCLTWMYKNPPTFLNPKGVTATNLTVGETDQDFARAVQEVAKVWRDADADPNTTIIESVSDIEAAKKNDQVGLILGFQHSLPLEMNLDRVDLFYRQGVRIIQLTYNDRTFAGDGCLEPRDGGLSLFGRRLIEEMNAVGMVLDLSHAGHRTSLEAIELSAAPPIFSHANPAALTSNPRNLTDEEIKAVAAAGGVVGCCTWAPICWKNREGKRPSVNDFLDHIDYVVDLVGIDHVGLATDSPCAEDPWIDQHSLEFNTVFPEIATPYLKGLFPNLDEADPAQVRETKQPEGIHGVQDLRVVTGGLLHRGYKPEDVKKVLGENFLRVFRQVWQ